MYSISRGGGRANVTGWFPCWGVGGGPDEGASGLLVRTAVLDDSDDDDDDVDEVCDLLLEELVVLPMVETGDSYLNG